VYLRCTLIHDMSSVQHVTERPAANPSNFPRVGKLLVQPLISPHSG
jgi:hypothetical protein